MKPLDSDKKAADAAQNAPEAAAPAEEAKAEVTPEPIDFSNVQIEPLFTDYVDFDTFSKSDFRAVKVKECEAVKKSKKLLKFVLDDGTGEDRIILSVEEIEVQIGELQSQIRSIQQEKISGDNIYRLLLAFDEVYHSATEAEQKEFMKAFIERIEMFPEKRKDGSWIKKIVFNFPVPVDGEEVKELPLETETTVETVVLMSRKDK